MLTLMLTRALLSLAREASKEYRYQTPGGDAKPPVVIDGFMPPKRTDADDDFPFILIRPTEGKTQDEGSSAVVSIIVGAYSEDYSGYAWAMSMASRLRFALLTLPDRMLERRFRLELPISWEIEADQPWPSWLVTLTTQWRYRTPDIMSSNEAGIYGYFEDKETIWNP